MMKLATIAKRAEALRHAITQQSKGVNDVILHPDDYGDSEAGAVTRELRALRAALEDVFRRAGDTAPLEHLYGRTIPSSDGRTYTIITKCGEAVPDHLTHSHHEIQRKGITCVECYRAWLAE